MKFDRAVTQSSVSLRGVQYVKASGNYQQHDQLFKNHGLSQQLVYTLIICHILSALHQTFNFCINSLTDFNVEEYPLPQIQKILLLYARDCEQFMKMMITFRDLLADMTKCKVRNYLLLTSNASVFKKFFKLSCINAIKAVILEISFCFILFILFVNSLTQNPSIYSQYTVHAVDGEGDWESVDIAIGGVQTVLEVF